MTLPPQIGRKIKIYDPLRFICYILILNQIIIILFYLNEIFLPIVYIHLYFILQSYSLVLSPFIFFTLYQVCI